MNRKIKVVHILYSFGTGGLEKGIATVIRHASSEFEHVILCLSTAGLSTSLLPSNIQVVELHKPSGNSVLFLWKIVRTLRSLKPDIVHTRNWSGIDGILASRLSGIASVVHGEHGWEMADPQGLNTKRVFVRKIMSHLVDEYTCVSRQIERWLKTTIKIKKTIHQIYNGVDPDLFSPGDGNTIVRQSLGISENVTIIAVIGRLDPIKNHGLLLEAYKKIRETHPNTLLLIVGEGQERNHLEKGRSEGVVFLGNRSDVPDLLKFIDIFVLPSRNEGISNTVIEAMSAQVPVIATRVGGNPEIVEDGVTGMLVDPENVSAMASGMNRYIENPEMRKMHGRSAREAVTRKYSVRQMVKSYEDVYSKVYRKKMKKSISEKYQVKYDAKEQTFIR